MGRDAKVEAGRERWGLGHVDGGRDAKVGAGAHGRRAGRTSGGRCGGGPEMWGARVWGTWRRRVEGGGTWSGTAVGRKGWRQWHIEGRGWLHVGGGGGGRAAHDRAVARDRAGDPSMWVGTHGSAGAWVREKVG